MILIEFNTTKLITTISFIFFAVKGDDTLKYKTGEYHILLFDNYGSSLKTKTAVNYTNAFDKLKRYLIKHPDRSGVINRILANSLDDGSKLK
jgi:hypothetical protein